MDLDLLWKGTWEAESCVGRMLWAKVWRQGMQDLFRNSLAQMEDPYWGALGDKAGKLSWYKNRGPWASLVAQWLRICLPMQGTQVRALVWEDPTCRGATKPMRHSYWACALEPTSHNYWAHVPQLLEPTCHNHWSPCATTTEAHAPRACAPQQGKPQQMRSPHTTTKSSPRSPQLEKARVQQQRPNAAQNK